MQTNPVVGSPDFHPLTHSTAVVSAETSKSAHASCFSLPKIIKWSSVFLALGHSSRVGGHSCRIGGHSFRVAGQLPWTSAQSSSQSITVDAEHMYCPGLRCHSLGGFAEGPRVKSPRTEPWSGSDEDQRQRLRHLPFPVVPKRSCKFWVRSSVPAFQATLLP